MRRLALQAEWRTVWYGTRGKFRCLSHKACMLTLNSESRHQKCLSCDVYSMYCAWVPSVSFGVCVSVCAFRCPYRWRCCKSPTFECTHARPLLQYIEVVFSEQKIQGMLCVKFSITSLFCLSMKSKLTKAGLLLSPTVCCMYTCVLCACGVSHQVLSSFVSIILAVCPFPSLFFRKHRRGCVGVGEGQKVKLGSHTGGVFWVSWHLGERFQLIRDPCVHFDGFAGE